MSPRSLVTACSVLLSLAPALWSCSSSKHDAAGSGGAPSKADAARDAAPAPKIPECKNGKPSLNVDGTPSGYVSCDGYSTHRAQVLACPSRLPRTSSCTVGACKTDADCTTKPYGYCSSSPQSASCFCNYGCLNDADCGAGHVCVCGEPVGHCEAATCTSDADCGGLLCLSAADGLCSHLFACQTPKDTCASPIDCKPPNSDCQWVTDHRECKAPAICP